MISLEWLGLVPGCDYQPSDHLLSLLYVVFLVMVVAVLSHQHLCQSDIYITDHRGGQSGNTRAAICTPFALPPSSGAAPGGRVRSRAASSCRLPRSVEEIVKQTTACAHDSSARLSAHGTCTDGRLAQLATSETWYGRPP